jgi:hypothetical protein
MARATSPGTAVERLAHDLFDRDPRDPMAEELISWLAGSARFRTFAVPDLPAQFPPPRLAEHNPPA